MKRPKRPCAKPMCPALVQPPERYCPQHQRIEAEKQREEKREYDRLRPSAAERGYDARWRRARKRYLAEHPLCVECERQGRLTPATVVDHVIPHKGDMKLFWDESNWSSLCKPCHDRKTARQDGRWGVAQGH